MTENAYFQVADTLSPVTSSLANTALKDVDPVLYNILRYFAGIIAIHVGPRFDAEVTAMGRPELVGNVIAQAVGYDPLPIATEDQYKFPLLCAYRKSETYDLKTNTWYSIKSEIEVLYVLPPISSDQGKRLNPLLTQIARVLVDRTMQGFDQSFNAGQQVWRDSGLDQIGMQNTDYGKFPGLKNNEKSNIWFPGISCTIQCQERRMPEGINFSKLAGFDGYVEAYDKVSDGYIFEVDVIKNF